MQWRLPASLSVRIAAGAAQREDKSRALEGTLVEGAHGAAASMTTLQGKETTPMVAFPSGQHGARLGRFKAGRYLFICLIGYRTRS